MRDLLVTIYAKSHSSLYAVAKRCLPAQAGRVPDKIGTGKHGMTRSAFTLLEILLVIAIIAILAGIVIVAINPTRQLAQGRDTQRRSDVRVLYSTLQQYLIDNGSYPDSVTTAGTNFNLEICNSSDTAQSCTGKVNLSTLSPTYLADIPVDELNTTNGTGYFLVRDEDSINVVTISPETEEIISSGAKDASLQMGLVGYWKMDGDWNDSSGNGFNGTASGNPTFTSGQTGFGEAGSFDGTGDYMLNVSIDSSTLEQASLFGWVNFEGDNNNNQINRYHWLYGWNFDYNLVFRTYTSEPGPGYFVWMRGSTTDNLGDLSIIYLLPTKMSSWHHLGGVYTGKALEIYFDGEKVNEQQNTDSDGLNNLREDFTIGGNPEPEYYYDSDIDEVRLYNRALSAEEVEMLYNYVPD